MAGRIADECPGEVQSVARCALDVVGGGREQPVHSRPDRSVAEQCNVGFDRHSGESREFS